MRALVCCERVGKHEWLVGQGVSEPLVNVDSQCIICSYTESSTILCQRAQFLTTTPCGSSPAQGAFRPLLATLCNYQRLPGKNRRYMVCGVSHAQNGSQHTYGCPPTPKRFAAALVRRSAQDFYTILSSTLVRCPSVSGSPCSRLRSPTPGF